MFVFIFYFIYFFVKKALPKVFEAIIIWKKNFPSKLIIVKETLGLSRLRKIKLRVGDCGWKKMPFCFETIYLKYSKWAPSKAALSSFLASLVEIQRRLCLT